MFFPESIIVVAAAALLSLALNRLMLGIAPVFGLMDQPGERRIHTSAVPRAGGIAIWLTFLTVASLGLAGGWIGDSSIFNWRWLGAFAAGSLVLMVAGVVDDRGGLTPWLKLAAHALAPLVFFLIKPLQTGLFPEGWHPACDLLVFVGWSVVLINAFNLIDGLDGLCGGLAAVAIFALAGIAVVYGRPQAAMLLLVMGGAVLGFLRYNYNPARIFLGDAGSMLLGFFIATAATEAVGRRAVVGVLLLPIAVAGVPLLDVLLAIWRRGARRLLGQLRGEEVKGGLFDADSDHLHHRLLASGGSQRKVAAGLQAAAVLMAVLAFLPMLFGQRMLALTLVGFLIVALVGVRHLARVEFEQTGSMVHMAIKLPGTFRRVAFVLFLYDLLVLLATGAAGVLVETNLFTRRETSHGLMSFVLVFTMFGCLATLMSRVHLRLWSRASMRDIVSLQFWLLAAALATFTLFSLAFSSLEWAGLRMALTSYAMASILIGLPRVLLDLFRDLGVEARHRNPGNGAGSGHGAVVVLGAGNLGALLLDHLKSSHHDLYPGIRILGFLDENPLLHGRRLRAFRVLGGPSKIPELVREHGLKGVVLAISHPDPDLVGYLETMSEQHGLRLYRWKVGIAPMEDEPVAVWRRGEPRSGVVAAGRHAAATTTTGSA
jgi:UDP-N-acetylmuramyl pentapeptide phosphotransferase/UDP-N-acetylglucosamine-1-phosphate transferase